MRARALAAAGAAGVLLALLPAGGAHAANGRITEITAADGKLRLVFAADSLAEGARLDPASVAVTVGGRDVPSAASLVTGAAVRRAAELVIDTSGSMRGEGIEGAKAAALAFVRAVPADVRVGLVTFSDDAAVRVRPTLDRAALRRAINGLRPAGETALYDGVLLGLRELGPTGVRSLLVLSDGADTSSKAALPAVLERTRTAKAQVSTVAFKTEEGTAGVLRQLAAAGGGRAVAASRAGDVGAAFRAAARAISNQLVVTADVPPDVSGIVTVGVRATAGGETLTDESVVTVAAPERPVDAAPRPVHIDDGLAGGDTVFYGALAALFLGVLGLVVLLLGALSPDRQQGRMRRRLSLYTLTGRPPPSESGALGDSGVARSAVDLADLVVRQRDFETTLARALERAGSALKPAEWVLIHAGVTLGAALLLLLLSGGRIVPTLLGFVLGFIGPYLYLSFRGSRRTNAFLAQVPDTLQLLAGSLSAGYSLPQAVDAVVREGAQPVAGEFGRAIVESRLGVPIEDALEGIGERMGSKDFAWVVMAIRIQREVGGNLAEVLTTVAGTMRERERVRRQVRVLSAEGRLSAWVLGGLPPLFAIYLILVRPTYIRPLFTDPIGILLLVVVGVLFAGGVLWMRKLVRVEV